MTFLYFSLQQRQNLQVQLSALQSDYDNLNARYEEESESLSLARQQLSKVNAEFAALKTRYDKEILAKVEEIEELRYRIVKICYKLFQKRFVFSQSIDLCSWNL